MSHFGEELARKMALSGLTGLQLSKQSGISASQISKWTRGEQTSIGPKDWMALAQAISEDPKDHADLLRAHLCDECFGPGSELVRIQITGEIALKDQRPATKLERAWQFLHEESLKQPDLRDLIVQLAETMGMSKEAVYDSPAPTRTPKNEALSMRGSTGPAIQIPVEDPTRGNAAKALGMFQQAKGAVTGKKPHKGQ